MNLLPLVARALPIAAGRREERGSRSDDVLMGHDHFLCVFVFARSPLCVVYCCVGCLEYADIPILYCCMFKTDLVRQFSYVVDISAVYIGADG